MSPETLQCVQAKDFNSVAFDSDFRSPWTKVLPIEILLSEAETWLNTLMSPFRCVRHANSSCSFFAP